MGEVSPLPTIWSQKVFWENTPLLSAGRRCGTDNTHTHSTIEEREEEEEEEGNMVFPRKFHFSKMLLGTIMGFKNVAKGKFPPRCRR